MIAHAGGDPWAINRMLQSGSPAQISSLAGAFHDAGQHTADADAKFEEARGRFEAAWNHQNGDHPINDAAEVRRATESLGVQAAQLPKIAVDLESLAASLAEAQRTAREQISQFEKGLEAIDRLIGDAHDALVKEELKLDAAATTTFYLHRLEQTRDRYAEQLHDSMIRLRTGDGYDASLLGSVDGYDVETPDQAEKDVHAALAGDQAAAARINAVLASISEEQVSGKKPLGREQASVLSQLQAQQHGMSVEALVDVEGRLGDQHSMIANSWQLMSNPAIVFPRTELKPGARQGTDTVKGGAAQLPESMQKVLNSTGLKENTTIKAIAGIVKNGSPLLQRNTEFDRGFLRKASVMLDTPVFQKHDRASHGEDFDRDPAFGPTVSAALSAVSPDHQVVHDFLVGSGGDTFLREVTHHFWLDNGKGAASLFNWTGDAAHGPEARIAAETAWIYSTHIGLHSSELLHLPGSHTLGEVNPDLVRGMAQGLTPYVNNIAGTAGGVAGFSPPPGTPPTVIQEYVENGTIPNAKGTFAVLSSDATAGANFNAAAFDQALLNESAYAQAVVNHEPNTNGADQRLHDAATLRGLVGSGIHAAVQADAENHHLSEAASKTAEYDRKKSAYELSLKTDGALAGWIPGIGKYAGPVVGIIGSILEDEFVGKPPTTSSPPTDHPLPNMSIGEADREILNALIAFGQHVDGISQYMINGHVAAPDQLARTPDFTVGAYDQALNAALSQVFAQNYGTDPAIPVVVDEHMIDRYNDVIKDPDPHKR
ncbi:putative alpha/beta hydrolase [Mycobacterium bourgelatii]|uniref:ESX-1 secretion-associated protein EspA/EspE-like domain-containing protein n=1 Tax=Mycobacterium bourgelatii TaxID=1273442 RepID=A0A7I9YR12_MYCBU|nr:hypothetical protein [Mycobacterium bourgelatii]MCV6974450.1 hypothetical protein [Mycobacterium bourgelatii]GFG91088.1 hypothetical protein MBOU_31300 [Mycobacterium bourgelatii]